MVGQRFVPVKKARPAKNPGFTALERPIQIASLSTSSLSLVILSSGRRKKGRRKARFLIILKTLLHRVVPRNDTNETFLLTISPPFAIRWARDDSIPAATKSPRESVRKKRSGRQRISNGRPSSTRRRPYKANISRRWLACFLLLSLSFSLPLTWVSRGDFCERSQAPPWPDLDRKRKSEEEFRKGEDKEDDRDRPPSIHRSIRVPNVIV